MTMTLLAKYAIREFLKYLALFHLALVALYLTIDFIQKIDNFIEAGASKGAMFGYLFFKTPMIINQMMPVATLLAVIVMLCLMAKNNEIIAFKACGVSIFQFLKPVIVLSLFLAGFVFLFSELVVPYASSRCNMIWKVEVDKQDRSVFYARAHVWYKGKNAIYWIRHVDAKRKIILDPTFYFFDHSFHLEKRIDARQGVWNGRQWKVMEGIIQKASREGGYTLERFDEMPLEISEKPEDFVRIVKKPEEMGYWPLKRYARKIQSEGYDATPYLVDMHIKTAFPVINFLMVLLAIPIALGLRRGGTPLAVTVGIAACFLYLLVMGVSRSLGLSGMLPPFLSAWLSNLLFFFLGAYLFMRLDT